MNTVILRLTGPQFTMSLDITCLFVFPRIVLYNRTCVNSPPIAIDCAPNLPCIFAFPREAGKSGDYCTCISKYYWLFKVTIIMIYILVIFFITWGFKSLISILYIIFNSIQFYEVIGIRMGFLIKLQLFLTQNFYKFTFYLSY